MSVSFPQMAFWAIFPLAALIVVSGWVMIIISAVKKLRARKRQEENEASRSSEEDPDLHQPDWILMDRIDREETNSVPLT